MLFLLLGSSLLFACGLFSSATPELVPLTSTATPLPLPPTPTQGAITQHFDQSLPDLRFGQSGNRCGTLAADLHNQKVTGTVTIFPNLEQDQLRAVTDDTQYRTTATVLNSSCRPTGQQYDLTANVGADYSATLGKTGTARCIQQSQLTVTSFDLQGLPGPLNAIAQSLIQSNVENLVKPYLDETVVRVLNGGNLPSSGAMCP